MGDCARSRVNPGALTVPSGFSYLTWKSLPKTADVFDRLAVHSFVVGMISKQLVGGRDADRSATVVTQSST